MAIQLSIFMIMTFDAPQLRQRTQPSALQNDLSPGAMPRPAAIPDELRRLWIMLQSNPGQRS
jgi:hypothetical protein